MKTIIVYYSLEGNTDYAAKELAKLLGADDSIMALGALAAAIGHCFPVFAKFKGGKAVATMYGYLFGLFAVAGRSPLYFFLPLVVFLIILVLGRIVSLSSMISAVVISLYICMQPELPVVKIVQVVFAVLIIVRHHANIKRIINHNENTISWLPK